MANSAVPPVSNEPNERRPPALAARRTTPMGRCGDPGHDAGRRFACPRHPRPPTIGSRREHDLRARCRVRSGVVMMKGDAQPPAHVRQLRWPDSPPRAGQPDRANERRPRRAQPVPRAAGVQDAAVERRVMGSKERRAVDPCSECRPQLAECRCLPDVLPSQPVESGERELRAGRPDQIASRQHDAVAVTRRQADRAGAIATCVRGLEVDRNEDVHHVGETGDSAQGHLPGRARRTTPRSLPDRRACAPPSPALPALRGYCRSPATFTRMRYSPVRAVM